MNLKENDVQDILFNYLSNKRHKLIVPNTKLFYWESDLISVTNSNLIYEYEIKISRQDFLVDKRKKKFNIVGSNTIYQPNYFYYVITGKFLKPKDLNQFSGLLYINKKFSVKTIRKPVILHRNKLTLKSREYLERGLMFRYWSKRQFKKEV